MGRGAGIGLIRMGTNGLGVNPGGIFMPWGYRAMGVSDLGAGPGVEFLAGVGGRGGALPLALADADILGVMVEAGEAGWSTSMGIGCSNTVGSNVTCLGGRVSPLMRLKTAERDSP